jgi:hypothetical protein
MEPLATTGALGEGVIGSIVLDLLDLDIALFEHDGLLATP